MAEGRIEIRLRSIRQLFNSMDASPFLEKDLDSEAEALVTSWARDLAMHAPIVLLLEVEEPLPPELTADDVAKAVRNFFAYRARMRRRDLRELLRLGRTTLLVAMLFLSACLLLREMLTAGTTSSMSRILTEGLLIIGWVAMWRPLEIWLFDWMPILREARIREHIAQAKVEVSTVPGQKTTNWPPVAGSLPAAV
jgi:hypothetical protein